MTFVRLFTRFSAFRSLSRLPTSSQTLPLSSQKCFFSLSRTESKILCINNNNENFIQKRFKKKVSGKQVKTGSGKRRESEENDAEEEEEEDDDDEDGEETPEIHKATAPNIQLATVGKILFNCTKQKFDDSFQQVCLT